MKKNIIATILIAFMSFATVSSASAAPWRHHHRDHHHGHDRGHDRDHRDRR